MRKLWDFSALVLFFTVVFAACGSDRKSAPPPVWVTISPYMMLESATSTTATVFVSGEASSSKIELGALQCPYYLNAANATGVTVTWTNLTTAQSGTTEQSIVQYIDIIPYDCEHSWYAYVPLVPDLNHIQVRASDESGNTATDVVNLIYKTNPISITTTT